MDRPLDKLYDNLLAFLITKNRYLESYFESLKQKPPIPNSY